MAITIDGKKYKVLENLGFQHSAGVYAKEVQTKTHGRPQMAVKSAGGSWRFWTPLDRIKPLAEAEVIKSNMARERDEEQLSDSI